MENLLSYSVEKHSKTNEDLHVYRIEKDLSKEEYIQLNGQMKAKGCYYSKFVKGFICEAKVENLNIEELEKEKKTRKKETTNVKYSKNFEDYMSIEEYKEFLKKYAEENYNKHVDFRLGLYKNVEELKEKYKKQLLSNLEHEQEYPTLWGLKSIREAILQKSLGRPGEKIFHDLRYLAIWEKLPIIPNLSVTKEAYTAMWGYDQTNVTIAYRLNKRVWGLDIFAENKGGFYLVRMKDGAFSPNSFMWFSRDENPNETFKQDASQTGDYR